VAEDLVRKVEQIQARADQQSICPHVVARRSFVVNRLSSGERHIWWRCDDCQINLLGPGYWVPYEYLEAQGIDIDSLVIVEDATRRRPPCRVCGARGTELHHWAPRHLFGSESDLWPTDYLCVGCHRRWHHLVERTPLAKMDTLPISQVGTDRGHVA
jgi:ribosomal protein L37AE/L43A